MQAVPFSAVPPQVILSASDVSGFAVIRLTAGKKVADYHVLPVPSDFGRAFTVEEVGSALPYTVCIADGYGYCHCRGFQGHGHCKHVNGLADLVAADQL